MKADWDKVSSDLGGHYLAKAHVGPSKLLHLWKEPLKMDNNQSCLPHWLSFPSIAPTLGECMLMHHELRIKHIYNFWAGALV